MQGRCGHAKHGPHGRHGHGAEPHHRPGLGTATPTSETWARCRASSSPWGADRHPHFPTGKVEPLEVKLPSALLLARAKWDLGPGWP